VKNTAVFVAFVLVVLGFLYAISGTRSPRIPEDANHAVFNNEALCLRCHRLTGEAPRKPDHPPKDECLKCHKVKRNRKG